MNFILVICKYIQNNYLGDTVKENSNDKATYNGHSKIRKYTQNVSVDITSRRITFQAMFTFCTFVKEQLCVYLNAYALFTFG